MEILLGEFVGIVRRKTRPRIGVHCAKLDQREVTRHPVLRIRTIAAGRRNEIRSADEVAPAHANRTRRSFMPKQRRSPRIEADNHRRDQNQGQAHNQADQRDDDLERAIGRAAYARRRAAKLVGWNDMQPPEPRLGAGRARRRPLALQSCGRTTRVWSHLHFCSHPLRRWLLVVLGRQEQQCRSRRSRPPAHKPPRPDGRSLPPSEQQRWRPPRR